jgi:signal transduction histidine kinase
MVQQAVDPARKEPFPKAGALRAPALGLRGGLGKTLLTAFLLLTTLPLALLAFLTYNQIQHDTQQKSIGSLETVVALKEAYIVNWAESYERELRLLATIPDLETHLMAQLEAVRAIDPNLIALALLERGTGEPLATAGMAEAELSAIRPGAIAERGLIIAGGSDTSDQPVLAITHAWADRQLVGRLRWDTVRQIAMVPDETRSDIATSLFTSEGLMVPAQGPAVLITNQPEILPQGILQARQEQNGAGSYTDLEGNPVFGAFRWNPDLQIALLAERSQDQALETGDTLTAVVVAATLAVALITVAISAVVTRRVTRPIVQLTETAAWMARGHLNQKVTVTRRDEIGILARAFNRMAAELRVLYDNLEAKVAERTQQLEDAGVQTRYYAMQLSISAEVARVATSIRDLDNMLGTVVDLIGKAFELHHVAIYLLDNHGEWAVWQVASSSGSPLPKRVVVNGPTLVGRVAADGKRRVLRAGDLAGTEAGANGEDILKPPVACEMAVPLRVRDRRLGVVYLQSTRPDAFGPSDQVVYQSLVDQISIAIENARAYAIERETVAKLRELDRIQARFLTNMSHALRTPLTSVIGFAQVMLKELDGPLTDLQRTDLTTIYEGGRQLVGLINDMLELTQLELGAVPFSSVPVNLGEIVEGVMATTHALARGKPIQIHEQIPGDLPTLHTDGQRVRQVILALLTNAVKFTDQGSIWLRVAADNGRIAISVSDTGSGITQAERAMIFSDTPYGEVEGYEGVSDFGLAISKRVVERLGGRIWVENREGGGTTFTFTLPIRAEQAESEDWTGYSTDERSRSGHGELESV